MREGMGAWDAIWDWANGLLELKRGLVGEAYEGFGGGGTKLSGSRAKPGFGGARSRRVSGKSASRSVSLGLYMLKARNVPRTYSSVRAGSPPDISEDVK